MKSVRHSRLSHVLLAGSLASIGLLLITQICLAQELSVDELPGDWEVAGTWDASGNWDVGGGPTSGVNRWATIRGDIFISGSLDYSHTTFSEGLTVQANDTLTIFGNLTFTSALMTLDIEDNGVLKVYGDLDTNGSTVSIVGDGVIVISGDLTIDGGSVYTDNAGGDDLYVDGTITGTGNGGDFSDLSSNHPTLYSEVTSELPVVLLGFSGRSDGQGVQLEWATASEENFSHFEVQRSQDGRNYSKIGEREGHGNSTQVIEYRYLDGSARGTTAYYRLKAVDFDGSYEIFESIRVDLVGSNSHVSLFPNPVSQYASTLKVMVHQDLNPIHLTVFDPGGRVLLRQHFNENTNHLEIKEFLATGIYHMRIQTAGKVLVKKFLVN